MTTQELLEALGEANDAFIMEAGRKQHKIEHKDSRTEQTGTNTGKNPENLAAKAAGSSKEAGKTVPFWKRKQKEKQEHSAAEPAAAPAAAYAEQPFAAQTETQIIPAPEAVQPAAMGTAEQGTELPDQMGQTAVQPEAWKQFSSEFTVTMEHAEPAEAAEPAEPAEPAARPAAVEAAEAAELLNIPAAAAETAETAEAPAEAAEAEENTENTENAENAETPEAAGAVLSFTAGAAESLNAGADSEAVTTAPGSVTEAPTTDLSSVTEAPITEDLSAAGAAVTEELYPESGFSSEAEPENKTAAGKQSVKRLMPVLIAACLVLVIAGAGAGAMIYHLMKPGASAAADTAVMAEAAEESEEAAAEAPITMQAADEDSVVELPAEEEAAEPAEPAWQLTPLAQAAAVTAPDSWDEENEVSSDMADAINTFSYQTAARILSGSDSSVCYSPLSLYQTLAVLASGAEGETQEQILSLMGISDSDTLAEEIQKSVRWNTKNEESSVLQISSSIWLDDTTADGTPIDYDQDWVVTASNNYYADVYAADFSDQATLDSTLGSWVAEKTGGLLTPTAEEMGLTSDTVMAIVNTLNYQTEWEDAFSEDDTDTDTFTTEDGEEIAADFMHGTVEDGSVVYGWNFTKSRLRLSTGKMIIVLPDEGVDIDDLLTEEALTEIFENSGYEDATVNWSIPKFDTTNAASDLSGMLQDLGVTDAFSEDSADFSAISDTPLYLSSIRQGTRITVNENGIHAAAWTAAGMETASAPEESLQEVEMNLNRPFLYLITSDDGSTLFMGVVRNPQD